jgi:hypothetical protein
VIRKRLLGSTFVASIVGALGLAACSSIVGFDRIDFSPNDSGPSDGSNVPDASGPDDARNWRYVFVSSDEHIGKFPPPPGGSELNGYAGADAFCKELADATTTQPQLRGLKWVAWLGVSGQREAWRRLPRTTPNSQDLSIDYRLRDGTVVFPSGFLFEVTRIDGGQMPPVPLAPIALDERTSGARTNLLVWTGTIADLSTHPANCQDWNADPDGGTGLVGATVPDLSQWSYANVGGRACTEAHHVYCFEVP